MRREVAGLLVCDLPSDSFIQSPAIEIAARALAAEPHIEASTIPVRSPIAGSQLGVYQLLEPLGRGGMGEVYLALDTRLGRKVALKLLPAAFTTDAVRVQRFAQEARAASALNHPNIITIHEIGEVRTGTGDTHYIVTEYVEGETLRQRMTNAPQGRLSLEEALDVAVQIAAALDTAHEAGIAHRDIKPENVMVRRDGIVKVLDFGLAKLTEPASPVLDSQAPTLARNSTEAGVVMGTPRYMSPEQARGEKVDLRTDIFSLGAMLYEMVTGRRPFDGGTVSDVIAEILKSEPPPLTEARPEMPPELQRIVSKALAKERGERYQAINDLDADLESLKKELEFKTAQALTFEDASRGRRLTANTRRSRAVLLVIPSLLLIAVAALLLAWLAYRYSPSHDNFESEILPQLKTTLVDSWKPEPEQARAVLSSSPDGNLLAFAKVRNGQADIYIKQINGGEARNLTNDAWNDFSPIWSPDGRRVAYISVRDGKVQVRLVHFGGDGQLLCTLKVLPIWLTSWTRDGALIYYEAERNLYALDVASGESRRLTDFPEDSTKSEFVVSADNQWLAYHESVANATHLFVTPLAGGAPVQVTHEGEANTTAFWLPDGERLIYSSRRNGVNQICVAFRDGRKTIQITFGHEAMVPWDVTPDGRKIFYIAEREESDLYLLDARTGVERRFSTEILAELFPAFAPDGRSVAFQQLRQGGLVYGSALLSKSLEGSETVRLSESGFDLRWSPSGDQLAFLRQHKEDYQLWTARKDGADARPVVKEKVSFLGYARKQYGWTSPPNFSWSPDGRRLVYGSLRTGQSNLYSIAADGTDETQLTHNTDAQLRLFSPIWAPDSKQFTYLGRRAAEGVRPRTIYLCDGAQHRALWQTMDEEVRLLGWSATSAAVYVAVIKSSRVVSPTEVKLLRLPTSQSGAGARATVVARLADTYLQNVVLAPGVEQVAYVVRQDDADNVWIASLPTGQRRRLTANADPNLSLGCLAWAPQADLLGFSKQSNATSIWMIENFK
ncbi:MAG: serine/threonine-protein kinase [Acidobacteria bacterium]|nr:serine/threonine-protein kinase [Acidobacteriota bacterium]